QPVRDIKQLQAAEIVLRVDEAAGDAALVAVAMEENGFVVWARQSHRIAAMRLLIVEVPTGDADVHVYRGAEDQVRDRRNLDRELFGLLVASAWHVVMVDDAHPVDLGAEMRRSP